MTTSSWTSGPRLSTARHFNGCFHIKDNNVITQIVVMGGQNYGSNGSRSLSSTEILDVNIMTWRVGPLLPISVYGNKGVISLSGTYLGFSTGGRDGNNQFLTRIYGLKKTSENVYTWDEVHSMTTARQVHSVENAPRSLLPNC